MEVLCERWIATEGVLLMRDGGPARSSFGLGGSCWFVSKQKKPCQDIRARHIYICELAETPTTKECR